MDVESTTLYQKLKENRGWASPTFVAILEPMLDLERTTEPAYSHVAWDGSGNLMGIPEGGIGYDAFIGWANPADFERNLRGLNAHVGGNQEEADLLLEHCLSIKAS